MDSESSVFLQERNKLVRICAAELGWDNLTYEYALEHLESALRRIKAERDVAVAFHDVAVSERNYLSHKLTRAEKAFDQLGHLLAHIHADQGEHTERVGHAQSVADARAIIDFWRKSADDHALSIQRLCTERDAALAAARVTTYVRTDTDSYMAGRSEGHADVAAEIRKIVDPEDSQHLNLTGLLKIISSLIKR